MNIGGGEAADQMVRMMLTKKIYNRTFLILHKT